MHPFLFQGKVFMEKYFSSDIDGDAHPALDMLKRLCAATKSLSSQVKYYLLDFSAIIVQ